MKKLFALLLCLTLFLPTMTMAEIVKTTYTIDFGDFTMELDSTDYYEVAPEKTSNAVYTMIYPHYDANAASHANFNVVWSADDASTEINLYGAENYASLALLAAKQQYTTLGITMTDEQVITALFEDNTGAFITYSLLDYSGMGYDMVLPNYQLQAFFCRGEEGTYIFTFTATSMEDLEALSAYLDTVEFN